MISEDSAVPSYHNHAQDIAYCHRKHAAFKIKSRSATSSSSTCDILATELQAVPEEVQGSFPKYSSMKRSVQRVRHTAVAVVITATTRADLPPLAGLFLLPSGEDFLKIDLGKGNDRILGFSTNANLDCLSRAHHWFADGTFKSQPVYFDQLFVIHGLQQSGTDLLCVPLLFCLTPNRSKGTYKRIFDRLKELRPNLAPASVMTDFEKASQNAFDEGFPSVDIRSCFFHFRQCVYRHIQCKLFSKSYSDLLI